jgi:peptide/nickel transport system substrate-binding protein
MPLRENVAFHDGSVMTEDDVVASLQRWLKVSPRAKAAAPCIASVRAIDPKTVQIDLSQPYSPLLILMSIFNGASAIMPRRVASSMRPITEFIGTGPYRSVEHVQDQYIRVGRFPH